MVHARLSIIDLDTGAQPMLYRLPDSEGMLGITFNGEIYNYQELKKQFSLRLNTGSDTEVIPALYYIDEKKFCQRLVGMFAFAIWDDKRRRLICARDRFGEKPFYYAITEDNAFVFASEPQAIIQSGLIRPRLDPAAVSQYLSLRYVHGARSMYADVRQLEPGCMLVWENGKITISPYWELPPPLEAPPSFNEAVEELRLLTRQAVTRCLVADVEVGLLLSGGLDSTTVASFASENAALRAFSFGFKGKRDERVYAREAALHYHLPYVEMTDQEMDPPYLLRKLPYVYGEPFADSSAPATLSLCKNVSSHVKVALTGDGADELLGGYDYWYQPLLRQKEQEYEISSAHWRAITLFSNEELQALGLPPLPEATPAGYGTLDDALRLDLRYFLPSDILKKTDRASMSYGLELRAPFLDRDLASFLIALPPEYKVTLKTTKRLMRQAFADRWPPGVRIRPKQGFGFSISDWMNRPDMLPLQRHYLATPDRKIRNLFPGTVIANFASDNGERGWRFLLLAVWLEHMPWI
jgi:asparagine synthase (glutamine-hydrolysing)